MGKKHLTLFVITVILVSSAFACLGVWVAGRDPVKTTVAKAVYKKTAQKPTPKPIPKTKERKPDYVMEATAYVDRGETKSRIHAGVGSVAVDRRVIPHGTLLYIEGYGLALATDTGRLIKGKRIDVWFEDEKTARRWGRKTVKVWKVGYADIKKILSTGGQYVKIDN